MYFQYVKRLIDRILNNKLHSIYLNIHWNLFHNSAKGPRKIEIFNNKSFYFKYEKYLKTFSLKKIPCYTAPKIPGCTVIHSTPKYHNSFIKKAECLKRTNRTWI